MSAGRRNSGGPHLHSGCIYFLSQAIRPVACCKLHTGDTLHVGGLTSAR